jgi:hypothetical protein
MTRGRRKHLAVGSVNSSTPPGGFMRMFGDPPHPTEMKASGDARHNRASKD